MDNKIDQHCNENPLVSIVVLTYNSSKFVLDTLQSAKEQSYKNIELIVSDDKSNDDTIEVCEKWITQNKGRFVNTQILTVTQNTGIPSNINRGFRATSGEWIKFIAGDDILLPDCVTDLLTFAVSYNYKHVVSEIKSLKDGQVTEYILAQEQRRLFFELSVEDKYKAYLRDAFFLNAPSLFFNRSVIEDLQPFDEEFKFLDDQPYFLNLFKNKIDLGFLNKPTVIYRMHSVSLMGSSNPNLFKNLMDCYVKYRKPFLPNNFQGKLMKWQIKKGYQIKLYNGTNSFFDKVVRKIFYKLRSLIFAVNR